MKNVAGSLVLHGKNVSMQYVQSIKNIEKRYRSV